MSNLLEIAETVFRQVYPNPTDETKTKLGEIISSAKGEYAYQLWMKLMAERREEGYFEVPSYLLTEKELDVVSNEIDLTGLQIMRSLPSEIFLQQVGGINCDCLYVKSTLNLAQVLCDDDSLPDSAKIYYVVGKKIKFPKGTHKTPLPIIYANGGEKVDDMIEVDSVVGGIVRRTLLDLYLGKVGKEDKTNNSSGDS